MANEPFDIDGLEMPGFTPFDPSDYDTSSGSAAPIELHWHGDADPTADRAWLVRDVIFQTGRGLLSGQWGAGKTFGALDLSASVMTGEPFAGKRVMRRGGVLFIAPEGAFEIPIRLRGIVEGRLKPLALVEAATVRDVDLDRLPIAWIEECPSLVAAGAVDRLVATSRVAADRMQEEFGLPLALIIIDTVAAAAGFKDENSAAEAQAVMNALGSLAHATGAFVLGVDHFGKATETGTRGSSAKEAAADTILAMLAKRDEAGTVSDTRMAVRKVRGARCGYEIPYQLEVVQVGENRDREPITTCIIAWSTARDTVTMPKEKERWPTSLRVFRNALEEALIEHGVRCHPNGADGPEQRAAAIDKVRAEFYRTYPADAEDDAKRQEAKKKAFKRAQDTAIGRGLVASFDRAGVDHLWIKPE